MVAAEFARVASSSAMLTSSFVSLLLHLELHIAHDVRKLSCAIGNSAVHSRKISAKSS